MVYAREQKRADIAEYRERFKEKLKTIDKAKLVFLDESGVNLNLTRRYGRAQGKARVRDYTPLNIPKSTTLLSSIRTDGTMIHKEFTGALNGQYFVKYIKEQLVPSLHKDDIVIMDNLRTHKVNGVKQAIESVGAKLIYLPPYSPDFKPIEMLWSKIKAILRNWKARTPESLTSSISRAYKLISLSDISGWFNKMDYLHS